MAIMPAMFRPFLLILLLTCLHLLTGISARKHHLLLQNDYRRFFKVSSFGYGLGGSLEVIVSEFSFQDYNPKDKFGFTLTQTMSDSLSPYLESHDRRCYLLRDINDGEDDGTGLISLIMDLEKEEVGISCNERVNGISIMDTIPSRSKRAALLPSNQSVIQPDAPVIPVNTSAAINPVPEKSKAVVEAKPFDPKPVEAVMPAAAAAAAPNPVENAGQNAGPIFPAKGNDNADEEHNDSEGGDQDPSDRRENPPAAPAAAVDDKASNSDRLDEKGEAIGGEDDSPAAAPSCKSIPPLTLKKEKREDGRTVFSFGFKILMNRDQDVGLYSVYFHSCPNYEKVNIPVWSLTHSNLSLWITEKNIDSFLSAGEIPLPELYFFLSIVFCIMGCIWIQLLLSKRQETFKLHYLMALLVFVKASALLFHGINYHFISVTGSETHTWAILYYVTHLLKGALLFITIVLIGTGWAFVKHILSEKDKTIASNTLIKITCFDVSNDFLLFGSNIGIVYGFRRRTRITNEAHFKFCLSIPSGIHHIIILSPDLILLSTACTLLIYSLSQRSPVWQSNDQTDSSITALKSMIHVATNSFHVLVGDSAGRVIKHVIQASHPFVSHMHDIHDEGCSRQQQSKRQEEEGGGGNPESESMASNHKHEIVQIDVIHDNVYLISTCFRTIIVHDNDPDGVTMIQVGRNERKVCGKYGAVYCPDQRMIYASRPSGHLIRASVESGQALQTYILKRAEKPASRKVFADVKQRTTESSVQLQMGRLMLVSPDLLLSYTSRSISLFTTRASLVIHEANLQQLLNVACLKASDSEFEIFILFQDRSLIRIRNVDLPILSSSSSSDAMTDPSSIMDGVLNKLIPHALSFPVMSSILATFELATSGEIGTKSGASERMMEESMKQNHGQKVEESQTSSVKLFSMQTSNSLEEDEENEPPLVTRKKIRKRSTDGSRKRTSSRESGRVMGTTTRSSRLRSNASSTCSLTVSRLSVFSDENRNSDNNSAVNDTQSADTKDPESPKGIETLDDNDKLMQILNAYREKVGIPKIESEEEDEEETVIEKDDGIKEPAEGTNVNGEAKIMNPVASQEGESNPLPVLSDETNYSATLTTQETQKVLISETEVKEKMSALPKKWILRLPSKTDLHFDPSLVICIAAFSDEMRDGLAMLTACESTTGSAVIHMFPGWRRIRCPKSGSSVKSLHVSCNLILLLYEDGSLYRCSNWRSRSRFAFLKLPPSFQKMQLCRTHSLLSLSVNMMDSICWSCDKDGAGWLIRLGPSSPASCVPVRDDSSLQIRLKNIVVSARNSAIVWATDDNQRLYCRAGIFNEKSDKDTLIAGVTWVPVDDLPSGQLLLLTASSDSVWILCRSAGREGLFRRCGICTPFDYVGSHWQEYELPVQSGITCIAASCTDDMWIMTDKGAVYQNCPHDPSSLKSVENGWLLV